MNVMQKVGLIAVSFVNALLVVFLVVYSAPARADDKPQILGVITEAVQEMTGIQITPEFMMMTGDEIRFDACLHPQKCPNYVSVHPPMSDVILVTTDINIAKDLSAQRQIAHVLTMYALEKAGKYTPGMPCKQVFVLEQYAHQIATAYVLAVQHEYDLAGKQPPLVGNPQTLNICSWVPPTQHDKDDYF